jgi:hypothetical protein
LSGLGNVEDWVVDLGFRGVHAQILG